MDCWIVAQTQAQREAWAAENVIRQGYRCYFPRYLEVTVRHGQKIERVRPLFPRYLFVQTRGQWHFLTGTFGVSQVVMVGARAAIIPDRFIAQLQAREGTDGLIILPNEGGQQAREYREGDEVQIDDPLLGAHTGIFACREPHDRVRVLLDYLGRSTPVVISASSLI